MDMGLIRELNALPSNIIKVNSLRKVYRIGTERVIALNHITLGVAPGEFVCLLGTSGSGKSTLLNLLAGLEKPTAGSIVIKGQRVDRMNEKQLVRFRQQNIGFIFQSYNLLPTMTALENVSLPLLFRGVPKRQRDAQAREILRFVGLETHLMHRPTQMSGGQQQRVGIARALVTRPPIVFADEPTGNLDSKTTREVMQLMSTMTARGGQTLVLVTHDMSIASYAHRIIHISDGNNVKIELNRKRSS
jgi:putative ABC transport system ATP-binding protein